MKAFVTGTDTGVGKTFATALFTRALRRAGLDTIALKPVCCGPRDDVEILHEAADRELTLDEINPVWLRTPVAPLVAAREENTQISLPALRDWFSNVSSGRRSVLVEGAGGWLVPVTDGVSIADLAVMFQLPVLVVVANRLGCLNHTLLTLESIRARGLVCSGLILNRLNHDLSDESVRSNRAILEELAGVPILAEIEPGQQSLDFAVV